MDNQKLYELNKEKRRGKKTFSHLKPEKVEGVWQLEFNGRVYRNIDKKLLIQDVETIENG